MSHDDGPLERAEAELYALRPEEFVAARDRLAATLRTQGDRATAAKVKAMRRPTLSTWAVNQLATGASRQVRQLVQLGEDLQAAQDAAVAGDVAAARGLLQLSATVRHAIAELVRTAVGLLAQAGYQASDAVRQRLTANLQAAIATPAGRAALAEGRLTRDLEPAGFGALTGGFPAPPEEAPPRRPAARAGTGGQAAAEAEPAEAEEATGAEQAADQPEAERETAAEREAEAERVAARREAAQRALAAAVEQERAADEHAASAAKGAEDAQAAATAAQARADGMREAAAGLRQAAEELAERARAAEQAADQAQTDAERLAASAAQVAALAEAATAELERARHAREVAEAEYAGSEQAGS
jgi:hypothetical protein